MNFGMKLIFIAGPYKAATRKGIKANIAHARAAAIRLWKEGYAVICPHMNTALFDGICPEETWLQGDLEILKRCDAIYLLDNWESSIGARNELQKAMEWNLEIIYEDTQ